VGLAEARVGRDSDLRIVAKRWLMMVLSAAKQVAARLGGNRACLAVARRLLKRSYHTLRELGEDALTPA
jgi:hypothetical protein